MTTFELAVDGAVEDLRGELSGLLTRQRQAFVGQGPLTGRHPWSRTGTDQTVTTSGASFAVPAAVGWPATTSPPR